MNRLFVLATALICLMAVDEAAYAGEAPGSTDDNVGTEVESPRHEDSSSIYSRTGAYIGVGGGIAIENFDTGINGGNSATVDFRIGYRAVEHLAIEAEYLLLDGFDVAGGAATVDGYSVTVKGKAYFSYGQVQPYMTVGVGLLDLEGRILGTNVASRSAFLAKGGLGVDAYLTEHIVLYIEATYNFPTGTLEIYDFVPLIAGIQFRF